MNEKLKALYLEILASNHAEGNGVNCCESDTIIREVMRVSDIKITEDEIVREAKRLCEEDGDYCECLS